jgi:myo-inositol-1(or 4)-monophosphatase
MRTEVLADLCRQVELLSKTTGAFILRQRERTKTVEAKSYNNFVTQVDRASEKMFVDGLRQLLPEAGFITEENTATQQAEYRWVIDPLDGTTNFIHGVPCFCTSVALLHHDEPILGVIYEVNLDECFSAYRKGGAYCNGKSIHVSAAQTLPESLLATGFPYYDYGRMKPYLDLFADLMQHSRGLRRLGSAATDMAYVACGRFEAFYEYGLHPWDVAAGIILVKEAGGAVCDFSGGENYLFGTDIICGTKGVCAALAEKTKQYFP